LPSKSPRLFTWKSRIHDPPRPRDLLAAVAAVVERDRAAHLAALEADVLRERSERLTPGEREVMALVAAGLRAWTVPPAWSSTYTRYGRAAAW